MSNRGLDYKLESVKLVREAFKARGRQVRVFTADPRVKEDIPCVAVNRIYSSEDDQGFANFYDSELTPDSLGTVETLSGLFSETLEFRVWTENADERDAMVVELKEILLLAKEDLTKKGFGRLAIRGGRDENDFRTYSPLMIYWGVFNMAALAPIDAFKGPDLTAPAITAIDQRSVLDGIEQTDVQLPLP